LLEVIKNKLKLSGIVRISVPNFKQIVKIYNASKDLNIIKNALMGGQSYNNDFHRSVYDFKEIYDLLRELGFKKIIKWNPKFFFKTSVGDWSEYKYVVRGRSYPISINIQATK
jgi:predicted SAM-dependent methyltransferase